MSELNKINAPQPLDTLDAQGKWQYPSGSESGHVEIELPTLPGSPHSVERLHVRDFGQHVIGKIQSSMNRQGYIRTGPLQSPTEVFRHYVAVAKGAGLMDGPAIKRMEELAAEYENEPDQDEYFRQVVRPYLGGLTPRRRR